MARRQATGFSLSVSRARHCALFPSSCTRPLLPAGSLRLARSHARASRSFSFSTSLCSATRRGLSSTLPRTLCARSLVRSPSPALHTQRAYTHIVKRTGSYVASLSLTLRVPKDAAKDPPLERSFSAAP